MNIRSNNEKIEKVFQATMELIGENGLHATPMSQISKKSGVSPGTIYHYFDSKETLINELYMDLKREMSTTVFEGYDITSSFKDRFDLIWKNYFHYLCENPLKSSFLEQCSHSPQLVEGYKEELERLTAPFIGFITEGIQTKQIKDIPLPLMFAFISSSIMGTFKLVQDATMEIGEDEINMAVNYCWDGLKA